MNHERRRNTISIMPVCWEGPSLRTIQLLFKPVTSQLLEKRREEHLLLVQRQRLLEEHLDVQRIENLRDRSEHFRLQEAIIEELPTH
jgi:hypothetical protein